MGITLNPDTSVQNAHTPIQKMMLPKYTGLPESLRGFLRWEWAATSASHFGCDTEWRAWGQMPFYPVSTRLPTWALGWGGLSFPLQVGTPHLLQLRAAHLPSAHSHSSQLLYKDLPTQCSTATHFHILLPWSHLATPGSPPGPQLLAMRPVHTR